MDELQLFQKGVFPMDGAEKEKYLERGRAFLQDAYDLQSKLKYRKENFLRELGIKIKNKAELMDLEEELEWVSDKYGFKPDWVSLVKVEGKFPKKGTIKRVKHNRSMVPIFFGEGYERVALLTAPRREFLHEKDEYLPRALSYGDYGKTLDTMKEEWYRDRVLPLAWVALGGSILIPLGGAASSYYMVAAGYPIVAASISWFYKRCCWDWPNIKKTLKSVEDLGKKGLDKIMPYLKNKEINELYMLSQSRTPSESRGIAKEYISRKAEKELRFKLLDEKFGQELI